jgi:hypothetical protein
VPAPLSIPNLVKIVQRPAAIVFELAKTIPDRHLLPHFQFGGPEIVRHDDLVTWNRLDPMEREGVGVS